MEFEPKLTRHILAPSDRSCMSLRRPFWRPLRDANPGTLESPRARVFTLLGFLRFLALSQKTSAIISTPSSNTLRARSP